MVVVVVVVRRGFRLRACRRRPPGPDGRDVNALLSLRAAAACSSMAHAEPARCHSMAGVCAGRRRQRRWLGRRVRGTRACLAARAGAGCGVQREAAARQLCACRLGSRVRPKCPDARHARTRPSPACARPYTSSQRLIQHYIRSAACPNPPAITVVPLLLPLALLPSSARDQFSPPRRANTASSALNLQSLALPASVQSATRSTDPGNRCRQSTLPSPPPPRDLRAPAVLSRRPDHAYYHITYIVLIL